MGQACKTAIGLLCALFLWTACGPSRAVEAGKESEGRSSSSQPAPPLVVRGLHLEEFGENGKTVDLWAARAEYSRDTEKLDLQEVRIMGSPGEGQSRRRFELKGDFGSWDLDDRVAEVRGNVRIFTEDGYVFFTEEARYDYDTREIDGPGPVRVDGPEGVTEGVGLHVQMNDETIFVQQGVRTVLQPSALQKAKERLK